MKWITKLIIYKIPEILLKFSDTFPMNFGKTLKACLLADK